MLRIMFVMCLLAIGCSQGMSNKKEVVIDDREQFPTACPVHNVTLMDSLDSVEAWTKSWDGTYLGTRSREFPLAMNHLTRYDADKVWIRHCPECRRVEAEWEERWRKEKESQGMSFETKRPE